MKVHIDEIPSEGLTIDLEEDGSRLFAEDKELRFEEKIYSHLVLHRVAQSVVLSGDARTKVFLTCSRCLEEFRFALNADIKLDVRPVSEISDGGEVQLAADEMDVQYYSEGAIDLNEVVMGQVAEGVPFKPLCSEACRGLCPQCGENLNNGECGCVRESVDPRLAKLKDLLKKENPQ